MNMYINGRKVVDAEIDGCGSDPCDYYFASAVFEDTGDALSDDELNELSDSYPEVIDEHVMERAIDFADYLCDLANDK